MLLVKPPYNILHFINILLSPNICTFWDTETFLHSHPIFSALPNLTFLTSQTQKFKFDKFLPCTLSPTQNEPKEPKRSQINPHLDHETAVHILLEEAAYRCFDLACTDLAHLSPNRATHLKSPKNKSFRCEAKDPGAICRHEPGREGGPGHVDSASVGDLNCCAPHGDPGPERNKRSLLRSRILFAHFTRYTKLVNGRLFSVRRPPVQLVHLSPEQRRWFTSFHDDAYLGKT